MGWVVVEILIPDWNETVLLQIYSLFFENPNQPSLINISGISILCKPIVSPTSIITNYLLNCNSN